MINNHFKKIKQISLLIATLYNCNGCNIMNLDKSENSHETDPATQKDNTPPPSEQKVTIDQLDDAIKNNAPIDTIKQIFEKLHKQNPITVGQAQILLHFAAAHNHRDFIDFLITTIGIDKDAKDLLGDNILHKAVAKGNISLCEYLIEKYHVDINAQTNKGVTPLQQAVFEGNLDMIRTLAKHGADINLKTGILANTALTYAIGKPKEHQLVELLHSLGADINIQNGDGYTPLHIAIRNKNLPLAEKILKLNPDLTIPDTQRLTPLSFAILIKNVDMVDLLLKYGADPNYITKNGTSPLFYATNKKDPDILKTLLKSGANPQLQSPEYSHLIPLQSAADNGDLSTLKVLLENPTTDINYVDEKRCGASALHIAIQSKNPNNIEVVKAILAKKPQIDIKGYTFSETPLSTAIQKNRLDIAQLLLEAGADIDALDFNGQSMLSIAIAQKLPQSTIDFLFDKGIDPNKTGGPTGIAPIHYAITKDTPDTLTMLLKAKKIDKELKTKSPELTPICLAISHKKIRHGRDTIKSKSQLQLQLSSRTDPHALRRP